MDKVKADPKLYEEHLEKKRLDNANQKKKREDKLQEKEAVIQHMAKALQDLQLRFDEKCAENDKLLEQALE